MATSITCLACSKTYKSNKVMIDILNLKDVKYKIVVLNVATVIKYLQLYTIEKLTK